MVKSLQGGLSSIMGSIMVKSLQGGLRLGSIMVASGLSWVESSVGWSKVGLIMVKFARWPKVGSIMVKSLQGGLRWVQSW